MQLLDLVVLQLLDVRLADLQQALEEALPEAGDEEGDDAFDEVGEGGEEEEGDAVFLFEDELQDELDGLHSLDLHQILGHILPEGLLGVLPLRY